MAFDTNVYLHHLQLVRACLQRLRTAQEGRILLPKVRGVSGHGLHCQI